MSLYHRILQIPSSLPLHVPGHHDAKKAGPGLATRKSTTSLKGTDPGGPSHITLPPPPSPAANRRITYVPPNQTFSLPSGVGYTPIIEATKNFIVEEQTKDGVLPALSNEDLSRLAAVATVSALRQNTVVSPTTGRRGQGVIDSQLMGSTHGGGGHDAPSWSRTLSASVLLSCTLLYAIIAGEHFKSLYSNVY